MVLSLPLLLPLHGIVCRILLQLGKAREIKSSVDERLERRIHLHRHKSYVDQLNRLFPIKWAPIKRMSSEA